MVRIIATVAALWLALLAFDALLEWLARRELRRCIHENQHHHRARVRAFTRRKG